MVESKPLFSMDPRGEIRIVVKDASCPGCSKGAVYWGFEDGGLEEWFMVQRVCNTMHVTECNDEAGCCKPGRPKVCRKCIYEKLPMVDGRGHDLWKLPWTDSGRICGTFGFGMITAEIRSFSRDVIDNNQWNPEDEIDFCSFENISVGEHRLEPPTYWNDYAESYNSYMVHGWDCCTTSKSTGFLIYGTTGMLARQINCGDGTLPRRPGAIIWSD
jgi:hypothetical protein